MSAMRLRRFGTFAGGIVLPDSKDATLGAPIVPIGPLTRLRVPLAPTEAEPARPLVEPGQAVSHGQRIAQASDARQVDVFAPLAGRVAGIGECLLPGPEGTWRSSPAIELVELDSVGRIEELSCHYTWQSADEYSIRLRIAEGGVCTCRPPVSALGGWIERALAASVETLIADITENTPFVTADHRLLAERGSEVIRGLAILARAVGARNVMLAVDHRRTGAYRAAVGPARLYGIEPIALPHKYPIGAEAMIVKVLTRREIPPGGTAMDVGVAVTDAATCWLTYRWVACGEPPTARVVTLSGPALHRPGNYLVPFGAEIEELLALAGLDAQAWGVCGPAMSGQLATAGAVTGPGGNAVLGLHPQQAGPPTQCIRCGWCSENCPARLNVAALNDDFELNRPTQAARRGVLACVGCGICSYLCPARLPLSRRVALLKRAIRQGQSRSRDARDAAQKH
ncbi:MAG: hypothetical protein B1H04_00235 [Planctomycetales bacterium 4484_123]|nr:MAG: hypothetical protein B1H04_00235 [Planctomycetales bacterium 4484_123]